MDMFPSTPIAVREMVTPDFFKKKKLKQWISQPQTLVAFQVYMMYGQILSRIMEMNDKMKTYFVHRCGKAGEEILHESLNPQWSKVENFLLEGGIKKAGQIKVPMRTCFKINSNTFVVCKGFTFGIRTVPKGYCHLLEITNVPMACYRLHQTKRTSWVPNLQDGHFDERDRECFDRFVLQPDTLYEFPEDTTYLFLTLKETIFCLHVTAAEGRYGHDPFASKKFLGETPPPPKKQKLSEQPSQVSEQLSVFQVQPSVFHVSEQPSQVSEQPSHVSEQPSQVSEQPSHVSEQPSHVSEQPSHMVEVPVYYEVHLEPPPLVCEAGTDPKEPISLMLQKSIYEYPHPDSTVLWRDVYVPPEKKKTEEEIKETEDPVDLSCVKFQPLFPEYDKVYHVNNDGTLCFLPETC